MTAASRVAAGPATTSRLSDDEALSLFHEASLHELGRRAFEFSMRLHPEPERTYVVDRNINYANWCTAKCIFCNFKADPPGVNSSRPELPGGYALSFDEIGRKIDELVAIGGTQILMQGGLVPGEILGFDWYLELLRSIRAKYPKIHVHAFSPPEIFAFHQIFGMSVRDVLLRLRDAGLDTIPGGGAEILVDRVRDKISRGKTRTDEYLAVMREAHRVGMRTSITMMFGHIETIGERVEHLRRVRELQDETGGFTAFICWTFQPENTPLGRFPQWPAEGRDSRDDRCEKGFSHQRESGCEKGFSHQQKGFSHQHDSREDGCEKGFSQEQKCERGFSHQQQSGDQAARATCPPYHLRDGKHLVLSDACDYLRTLSIARLYLDNVPNIQSSWVTQGPKIGQLALFFGANDMGSVMMEENVVSAAGTTYRLSESEIRRLITDAGWQPQKRNCYYEPVA